MKIRFEKRLFLLILCCFMIFPLIAACNKNGSGLSWEMTESNVVSLDMAIEKGDFGTELTVSYPNEIFKDVKNGKWKRGLTVSYI